MNVAHCEEMRENQLKYVKILEYDEDVKTCVKSFDTGYALKELSRQDELARLCKDITENIKVLKKMGTAGA